LIDTLALGGSMEAS